MSTKKLQILGSLGNGNKVYVQNDEPENAPDGSLWVDMDEEALNGGNADTLDGKHAAEFASTNDVEYLRSLIGDTAVTDQISLAVSQKSQVQIITWEADD
jgi:hypothetical protein